MIRKCDPVFDQCLICQDYTWLVYKDGTLGTRSFCHECFRPMLNADDLLSHSHCGLKDPPPEMTYSARHRLY
jgi:hypothetical protein